MASPLVSFRLRATLTSEDDGTEFEFPIPPSEQERTYEADWQEVGVAQASPQHLESLQVQEERRVIRFAMSAYDTEGLSGSLQTKLNTLKRLTRNAPGKKRPHICVFAFGVDVFRCVVKSVRPSIDRAGLTGASLRAPDCTIELWEVPARR